MSKIISTFKEVARGIPMALLTIAAVVVVVKLIANVADRVRPGSGETLKNVYRI